MKERPILFSAPMVRAILAGNKTQTRRAVKPQPPDDCARIHCGHYHPTLIDRYGNEEPGPEIFGAYAEDDDWGQKCPYGQPGDRLWVRETFQQFSEDGEIMYKADPESFAAMNELKFDEHYEARWRPSIHMPRRASRILLEITDVRVERLQSISERDAWAEGCEGYDDDVSGGKSGYREFYELWCDINGRASWNANPWVWVVEFKRVTP